MTNALPVLSFNTTGPIHLMAQLHADGCAALRRGRGTVSRFESQVELDEVVLDLEERGYPVSVCKCVKRSCLER